MAKTLQDAVNELQDRLNAIEQRPAQQPQDDRVNGLSLSVLKLQDRVEALEKIVKDLRR